MRLSKMADVTGKYISDDVEVWFSNVSFMNDLGVPRSSFEDINNEDAKVTALSMLGVDVEMQDLPSALQDAVNALAEEVDWEQ